MRSALGFLTVVGGASPPDRRAPAWFGLVGAAVGLAVGGVWWVAGELWPPVLAAILAVAADAALTGLLHYDGLADAADGLLPPVDRARRLAIMATPDVGAFGLVAVVLVVVTRVAALAALDPDPLLVAGLWAATRAAMALTLGLVPYARAGTGGAAAGFAGGPAVPALLTLAAGLAVVVATTAAGVGPGLATAAAAAAGFAAVVAGAVRRLGGYTGDVLGAAGLVAETVGLLVAAARW
ncbi:MAG TPA: adenosylcobinamide-GDP ribazoletransferase [Acidimicrobiales bacterium]